MGDRLEELPLFPVNTVLFPYAYLQLHVLEDRHKEMIRYCTQNDQPFGVNLIRSRKGVDGQPDPYMVGTAVRIVSVHTFDDGKMDVRVHGQRRFRARRIDDDGPFLVGWVEPVYEMEIEEDDRVSELVLLSREYVEAYIKFYFARNQFAVTKIDLPSDPTQFSFAIANFLQIENLEKQRLLETTDTLERLEEMIPILEQHIVEAKTPEAHKVTRQHMEQWINPN